MVEGRRVLLFISYCPHSPSLCQGKTRKIHTPTPEFPGIPAHKAKQPIFPSPPNLECASTFPAVRMSAHEKKCRNWIFRNSLGLRPKPTTIVSRPRVRPPRGLASSKNDYGMDRPNLSAKSQILLESNLSPKDNGMSPRLPVKDAT